MNRRPWLISVPVAVFSMSVVFAGGCQGCSSCSGKTPAPAAAVSTPESTGAVAIPDKPSAVTERPNTREQIASIAEMIPFDAAWVAVFQIDRMRDQLHKIARIQPKLVRSKDYHDVHARILDVYGIDTDKVEGPCLMAGLKSGGRVLVCAKGESVVEPVDSARWTVDTDKGPTIIRRDALISTGVVDGRVIAGDQNAVFEVLRHYRAKQPSLAALFKRAHDASVDLVAEDGWRDFALFFPGSNPGWCDPSVCRGTAIFGGRDGIRAISIASTPDSVPAVRAALEGAWRDKVAIPWTSLKARPNLPPEYSVDAERSITENSVQIRADRVILNATGDIYDLMSVILVDPLEWIFGV
jgi:hypothetical protein